MKKNGTSFQKNYFKRIIAESAFYITKCFEFFFSKLDNVLLEKKLE